MKSNYIGAGWWNKKLSCHREAARCCMSLKLSLVTQCRLRSFEMTPIGRACKALLATIGGLNKCPILTYSASIKYWRDLEIWVTDNSRSLKMVPFEFWKLGYGFRLAFHSNDCNFSCFDTIHGCDRQILHGGIDRAYTQHRVAKNCQLSVCTGFVVDFFFRIISSDTDNMVIGLPWN